MIELKYRIKCYKYFNKLFQNLKNYELFKKKKKLGKGYQGTVYKYCQDKQCVAVKQIKISEQHADDIYNPKALKYGPFIELAANQLVNELVLQKICPHFILNYGYQFTSNKVYFYNELLNKSSTYTEWVRTLHSLEEWYNAFFQILIAVYSIQKYFNMTHLDLHSDNILVINMNKGGYWKYIIDDKIYYLPNLGYQFYIIDFENAWIPEHLKSWLISTKYKKKSIHKGFDIYKLFKSTLHFDNAPKSFKKDVNFAIRQLRQNIPFQNIIETIFYNKYNSIEQSKPLDIYNTNKQLKIKHLPIELQQIL